MKLFSLLSFGLLFCQSAFTMDRRNQALANVSDQTHLLADAAGEFAQMATRLHQQAQAEEEKKSNRAVATVFEVLGDLYKKEEQNQRNLAPQSSSANQAVRPTAAPAVDATQVRVQRSNEINQRLRELAQIPASAETNAEHIDLIVELAQLTKSGAHELAREFNVPAGYYNSSVTSVNANAPRVVQRDEYEARAEAARLQQESNLIKNSNFANTKARKWFFFSLAGFSFTFFSWKYSWLPEKATYGCGAASTFFGLKTLQWSYHKLQVQKKLAELRK